MKVKIVGSPKLSILFTINNVNMYILDNANNSFYFEIDGVKYIVKDKFITDLTTFPNKFIREICNENKNITNCAVIHDHLYKTKIFTRYKSDKILFKCINNNFLACLAFIVVHFFGKNRYK
jgi:hypothetical protein